LSFQLGSPLTGNHLSMISPARILIKSMSSRMCMKLKVPAALREQVWLLWCGDRVFKHKCIVTWCENMMTPFAFEVGHNVPESWGGSTDVNNLRPICAKCNRSMGDDFTIDSFSALSPRREQNLLWESYRCHVTPAEPRALAELYRH
jgi:hypothetical protein